MYSVHTDLYWGIFLHVFVVVINCTCQVVTCIVQLCAVFILILIGGQRDKGVSPTPISYILGLHVMQSTHSFVKITMIKELKLQEVHLWHL